MKILFVVSEVEPLAKTGGLADVAAALPKALAALGHDVRIALPLYRQLDRAAASLAPTPIRLPVRLGTQTLEGRVWSGHLPGSQVTVYAIEQEALYDRDGLYGLHGRDHPDNLERFSFFSQAALCLLPQLSWRPEVVHCHDWQAALAAAHLKFGASSREPWCAGIPAVLTIHNLSYQGVFPKSRWAATQLPDAAFSLNGLEFYDQINCLKGGIVSAARLTTVSPTYAREIQTPQFGWGLEGLLRARAKALTGILNGIDVDEWNPATDRHLAATYTAQRLAGKAACKQAVQQRLHLAPRNDLLIGMVQRLVDQKGIDIVLGAMEELMALPVQLAVLGTGEPAYHRALEQLAKRHPDRVSVTLAFDHPLAHQIEAGADAFLMASKFEPCGLNQMYSMRYGTVPIVKRVGGLADTVADLDDPSDAPTGFVFEEHAPQALLAVARRALALFRDRAAWTRLIKRGMRQDFSWRRSAQAYVRVYQQARAPRAGHRRVTRRR
ncbi:MAG: glycogen synthase GlgA [Candidatus Omnitrophica bacterium]|nr:glycogen synthase GlgA [Candidatus Omnitrophota bacterium]